jgi:5'-3' exonuclease
MGIPAFFRQIIERYPKTHNSSIEKEIDYFFIDFNSIIYDIYAKLMKEMKINGTNAQFENLLIKEVVKKVCDLCTFIVKPNKMIYLALDGSAPRAKMVQQRWRRYKHVQDDEFLKKLKKKYGIAELGINWDTSSNIAPGTKFMKKLSNTLKNKINSGTFNKHNKFCDIILSDANVPGEGEHKFLPIIRDMNKNSDERICIYSPDADMIVLAMATMKKNIYILRKVKSGDDASDIEKSYKNNGHDYLYLSIDEYTKAFIENLNIETNKYNNERIIIDYVFLTFLGGNDFVMPIPYLKIREEKKGTSNTGGLGILLNNYKKLLPQENDYLIQIKNNKYLINQTFFIHILEDISRSEDYFMKGIQLKINKVREGMGDDRKLDSEEGRDLYTKDVIRYEHYEYYSQLHPEYEKYKSTFNKFDFTKPKYIWKEVYYNHFFGLKANILPEYNTYRTKICINYLESLVFTLRYYFEGIPSWSWYYQFRAPPTASDLLTNMKKYINNINDLIFKLDAPYKPLHQLMMILPPQMGKLLPKSYHNLMKTKLLQFYPIGFELDVVLGGKHIYSEPILPNLQDNIILDELKIVDNTLTKDEIERNTISFEPYIKKGK